MRTLIFLTVWLAAGLWVPGSEPAGSPQPSADSIHWQPWSDSIFAQAKREHKFVLLDLEAVWCHWCHVMDKQTYSDPKVIALINSRYLPVRVDEDSRPDLANRYEDYGWPATVVFNARGGEIVKRSGYLPPLQMTSMLQAIIADPTPGPSVTNSAPAPLNGATALSEAQRAAVVKQLLDGYDPKLGGWGRGQKFLNWGNVEYCLVQAHGGDAQAAKMAKQTLAAQLKIIDPVWGGVDQYSAGGDWDHPHFEKIMEMQAENMRIYAMAYSEWKDPVYLHTAEGIYGFVRAFLTSPDGVTYPSQDADLVPGQHSADYYALDDAGRRKLGLPRVDHHVYARENGWFISALAELYAATGNPRYRDEAVHAAKWIIQHRSVTDGGFSHDGGKTGLNYLGDTLAMGQAFLDLNRITGEKSWLDRAGKAASFIQNHFSHQVEGKTVGFATAAIDPSQPDYKPGPEFDENVDLARFTNLLFHETGTPFEQVMAQAAMHFLATPAIWQARESSVGGLLLADRELNRDPLHIAVVGKRSDSSAQGLFLAALAYPSDYRQVEWIDPDRPVLDGSSIPYPHLPQAAAYVCSGTTCSSPVLDVADLIKLLDRKTTQKP